MGPSDHPARNVVEVSLTGAFTANCASAGRKHNDARSKSPERAPLRWPKAGKRGPAWSLQCLEVTDFRDAGACTGPGSDHSRVDEIRNGTGMASRLLLRCDRGNYFADRPHTLLFR